MSQTTQEIMTCVACGLKYPWAARLVGKKIRCKCGATFIAPASADGHRKAAAAAYKSLHPVDAHAQPASPPAASRTPPAPPTPPGQGEPVIDLKDDDQDDGDAYELADDLDAPPPVASPPLTPMASPPAAAPEPASGRLPAATAPYAGYKPKKFDDASEKKSEIKKLVFIGAAALVLVGLFIGLRAVISGGGDSAARYAELPGEDGRYHRLADRDTPYDAREWLLGHSSRGVIGFEWTREKTEKMLDRWYSEGVKKVIVFGQAPMTATFCVELPDEPIQRKAFIDYAENWRTERHQTSKAPVTDAGQKYVFLDFMIIK